jgi:ATP-dependent DNA helicase RecQ
MVYSGTKLNLKYYINTILDEDVQQDIFDYFKSSESDSLDLAIKEFDNEISKEDLQLMRIQFISELAN